MDLTVVNNSKTTALYLNKGNGTFQDVTAIAGSNPAGKQAWFSNIPAGPSLMAPENQLIRYLNRRHLQIPPEDHAGGFQVHVGIPLCDVDRRQMLGPVLGGEAAQVSHDDSGSQEGSRNRFVSQNKGAKGICRSIRS